MASLVSYQINEEKHEEQKVGAGNPPIHMIPQEHPGRLGGHITPPENEEEASEEPDYNGRKLE